MRPATFLALNVVGLPGNWINLVAAGLYAWLMPIEHRADFGWIAVGIMLLLATLGEIVEFAAGAVGSSTAGGSKRGAGLALVGALTGGIVGIFLGLPIPFVGPIISPILFSAIGALIGAMLGEQWKGRDLKDSFWVGHAAFWGRLVGTLTSALPQPLTDGVLFYERWAYPLRTFAPSQTIDVETDLDPQRIDTYLRHVTVQGDRNVAASYDRATFDVPTIVEMMTARPPARVVRFAHRHAIVANFQ